MGNNAIQIFNYKEQQVRTTEIDGEVWFVGKDVAEILGYQRTADAIAAHVDDEDKLTRQITDSGQRRDVIMINESGLYSLIFSSKLPSAKKFKHWVTHEVLPEIRRKGYYAVPAVQSQIDELKQEVELLQAQNAGLKKYIQENSSFIMLGQAITPVKASLSVGESAKIFAQHGIKIGQNRLYKLLRDMGIIAKRKGRQRNQPTQKSIEQGLCVIVVPFGSKGIPYLTMKCLQKVSNVLAQKQYPLLFAIEAGEEEI